MRSGAIRWTEEGGYDRDDGIADYRDVDPRAWPWLPERFIVGSAILDLYNTESTFGRIA